MKSMVLRQRSVTPGSDLRTPRDEVPEGGNAVERPRELGAEVAFLCDASF